MHPNCRVVELTRPDHIIGKNTVAAMQAGIVYGYVGHVEGIVARMKAHSKVEPTVIATGGIAELIASETKVIDIVDNFLNIKRASFNLRKKYLKGVRIV